jgi:hypothetical protein
MQAAALSARRSFILGAPANAVPSNANVIAKLNRNFIANLQIDPSLLPQIVPANQPAGITARSVRDAAKEALRKFEL